jgi:hypothetical protein
VPKESISHLSMKVSIGREGKMGMIDKRYAMMAGSEMSMTRSNMPERSKDGGWSCSRKRIRKRPLETYTRKVSMALDVKKLSTHGSPLC